MVGMFAALLQMRFDIATGRHGERDWIRPTLLRQPSDWAQMLGHHAATLSVAYCGFDLIRQHYTTKGIPDACVDPIGAVL
jgi:hypothetical protein